MKSSAAIDEEQHTVNDEEQHAAQRQAPEHPFEWMKSEMTERIFRKLHIDTLGCPKNVNDSECAAGIWEAAGLAVTADPLDADVFLVNTCGFIGDAKKDSIDHIFTMADLAERMEAEGLPRPLLVVSGCLSQRYGEELAEEMPEVDLFLGVNEYEDLPRIVADYENSRTGMDAGAEDVCGDACGTDACGDPADGLGAARRLYTGCAPDGFSEFSARKLADNPYTATLRIAEGCNNRCAYCVIPSIRGPYRSRKMEDVLAEAARLAQAGCREVILIAQDVTEYGRDLYGELRLPRLLRELCRVEGIRWIRLMYCYEDKISDELIRVMAEEEKICHYIDIPLQHVSDEVLRAMGRRSTSAGIRETIGRLRKAIPDIHIRTTFITGFPGETGENMAQLTAFVEETRLERLGVFAYSREEGTPAGERPDQIDEEVRAARAEEIMRRQVEISREKNREKVGSVLEVLIDGIDGEETAASEAASTGDAPFVYLGRTQYDAPEIDNMVILQSDRPLQPGDMVQARIIDAFDYDLTAELVSVIT